MGVLVTSVVILLSLAVAINGYGEPDSKGLPNWQERALHSLTNGVRIDPKGYLRVYYPDQVNKGNVLNPSVYPPVAPFWMELGLVESAHSHSQEMADKNYFSHNSADGTGPFDRIKQFFKCFASGENIAAGGSSPVDSMKQWLCDGNNNACAPDKNGDGHRANIMGGAKAMGSGFGFSSSSQFKQYWTQDMGDKCSGQTGPVYDGSHLITSGTIKFLSTYYDANGRAPTAANVVVGGQSHPLTVELGSGGKALFKFEQPAGSSCRSYFFQYTDASGASWRYPTTGCLITFGEGNCQNSFDASCPGGGSTNGQTNSQTNSQTNGQQTNSQTNGQTSGQPSTTGGGQQGGGCKDYKSSTGRLWKLSALPSALTPGGNQATYSFGVCGNVNACGKSGVTATQQGSNGNWCFAVGRTEQLSEIGDDLRLTYTNGDGCGGSLSRSATLNLKCDTTGSVNSVQLGQVREPSMCVYTADIVVPSALCQKA